MRYLMIAAMLLMVGCSAKYIQASLHKIKWNKSAQKSAEEKTEDELHFGPGPESVEVGSRK